MPVRKPLYIEQSDGFYAELSPQEDQIEVAGVTFDDATNRDESTRIWRDGSNLTFQDPINPTPHTLTELLGGSYSATTKGQILISLDGSSFVPARPVVDDDGNTVTDGNYELVVEV
jgi:hypothetical protein